MNRLKTINEFISKFEKNCVIREAENRQLDAQILELEEKNKALLSRIDIAVDSIKFIEDVANQEREDIKTKVENIVTEALLLVYGDKYGIEFSYSIRRNRTAVDIYLTKDSPDGQVRRTMGGFGGGVADTIALPLKLLVLLSSQQVDRILVCDEPGKHLDVERVEFFFSFLRDVCEKMDMQIILSSHFECAQNFVDHISKVAIDDSNVSSVENIKVVRND